MRCGVSCRHHTTPKRDPERAELEVLSRPGKKFQGKSLSGVYGDLVMEVDHAVERVINALKEEHFYENTLVRFSSLRATLQRGR